MCPKNIGLRFQLTSLRHDLFLVDSSYAKVCKKRRNGRIKEVVHEIVFGDPAEVMNLLGVDLGGSINTAYIERPNLTIRNSLARFVPEL